MSDHLLQNMAMKKPLRIQIRTLKGPINVTYREQDGKVYARALEFDLIGIGENRSESLRELQDIVGEYVYEVLNTKGKVRFFNPSIPEEWENTDKEPYLVTFVIAVPVKTPDISFIFNSIEDVKPMRKSVRTIQLQPLMMPGSSHAVAVSI